MACWSGRRGALPLALTLTLTLTRRGEAHEPEESLHVLDVDRRIVREVA